MHSVGSIFIGFDKRLLQVILLIAINVKILSNPVINLLVPYC